MGWLPGPCPAVFPEPLMSVTFTKMHKALISARLTFPSRNPSVKPTHGRGKLQNQNRNTHFMKERVQTPARTYSRRMKTLNPISIILSTLCFQAFTLLFLWSRKVPVLSVVSTLYFNSFAPLHNRLGRNWWWEWKLRMFGNCRESLSPFAHC